MIELTPHHISITLRAICYSQPLPTTPLFRLQCVPDNMYDHLSSEVLMTDWLVSLIHDQLNYHRAVHNLPHIEPDASLDVIETDIREAFAISVRYVQAWTILYARIVRHDLDLTMERLGEITNTHPRTLRRRQQLGVHCLFAHIIRLEREQ